MQNNISLFFWRALVYFLVEDGIQHPHVVLYLHFSPGTSFFVLHSFLSRDWVAAEQNLSSLIWVFLLFNLVKPVQPGVAFFKTVVPVLVEFALETGNLAEMVGVEWLGFKQSKFFPIIVQKPQYFWLFGLLLRLCWHYTLWCLVS